MSEPPDIPYPPPDTPFMPLHPAWKPGDQPSESGADLRPLDLEAESGKSQGSAWLLTVCDVPAVPRYLDLVKKLGFTRSRRNLDNWCRRFDPGQKDQRATAREIVAQLKRGGLPALFWMRVAVRPPAPRQSGATAG